MIKVTLLGKTGPMEVLFMNKSYLHHKQSIQKYLSRIVKISGRAHDNTFFASTVRLLPPKLDGYYLVLDTLEKTKKTAELMRERKEGIYRLTVEFHFDKNGQRIPLTVASYSVSEDLLSALHAVKIWGSGKS